MKHEATFSDRFKEVIGDTPYIKVSELLGISTGTISNYASGKSVPRLAAARGIAQVYHVDPHWLMGYDVPKYEEAPADRDYLIQQIKQMDKDSLQRMRIIVDQILALRDPPES